MLHAVFHNVAGNTTPGTCRPAAAFILTPGGLVPEGEADPVAVLQGSLWWIGDVPYATGEIGTNVTVSVEGQTLGPFARVRLVADYVFGDEKMVAEMKGGTWFVEGKEYGSVRCSEGGDRR